MSEAVVQLDQEGDSALVEFDAHVVPGRNRSTVVVRGEVDRATVAGFAAILDTAIRRSPRIELKLQHLSFMDTTGLRVLVDAHVRLGQVPDAIVLHDPPLWLRRLLRLVGVEGCFTLRETGPGSARHRDAKGDPLETSRPVGGGRHRGRGPRPR